MTREEVIKNKNKITIINGEKYKDVTWKYIDNTSKSCVGVYEPILSTEPQESEEKK